MPFIHYPTMLRREFAGYGLETFRHDLLAGLTVGAVALPLALAFGVASGADAPAGLVTAILGGLIIGALSGAPYQISGPTGAMSAVLIVLAQRYGLSGVWAAGVMAGTVIFLVGLFRLGRFIAFIPAPVITGFTAGIAAIIAIGQIDNLLGVSTPEAENSLMKLFGYLRGGYTPDWHAVVVGLVVMGTMIFWPKRLSSKFPGSLLGIVLATAASLLFHWPLPAIGEIPRTILLENRLTPASFPWEHLGDLAVPALSIAALGAVESLLCGAVASNMTGIRLYANQELVAQGLGNVLIPFFGGVPATAAIARSSVGIKSGGKTRVVSIVHALTLLAAALVAAPLMAPIPLAALAGVLMVTAYRMNEWHAIRFMFGKRFKTAMITFGVTLLATVALDLTQAILIGAGLSAAVFINQIASVQIDIREVDPEKMRARGYHYQGRCPHVRVAYITGPLFFAATGHFNEAFARLDHTQAMILSLRAMPLIDTSGIEALIQLHERLRQHGAVMMLAGTHPEVERMLDRAGLLDRVGRENLFWSADQAILAVEERA